MNDPEEDLRWEEVEGWLIAARLDRDAALACLEFEPALALRPRSIVNRPPKSCSRQF
jgi:hypothetical protein